MDNHHLSNITKLKKQNTDENFNNSSQIGWDSNTYGYRSDGHFWYDKSFGQW